VAVINIGSGSVKLRLNSTGETKAAVTLLALSKADKKAARDTFDAVASFCREANRLGEDIVIFGTEAMRSHGEELSRLILDNLGIAVDIIDGETEAKCGFLGIPYAVKKTVIDVGGASTEVAYGDSLPSYCKSMRIGSAALYGEFGIIVPDKVDRDAFFARLFERIDGILDFDVPLDVGKTFLIGGGATNMLRIIYGHSDICDSAVTKDGLWDAAARLFDMDIDARTNTYPFLEPKRALVLPYGAAVLCRALNRLCVTSAQVSSTGLIDGYIKLRLTP
jgi:exopolyphosphatase/guanosine-5'-triphosphate,3'-diphosphate pyrophosphatase